MIKEKYSSIYYLRVFHASIKKEKFQTIIGIFIFIKSIFFIIYKILIFILNINTIIYKCIL